MPVLSDPGQAGRPHPVEDGEGGQRAVRGLPGVHRGAAEPRGKLRRGREEGAARRRGEFPGVLAAPLPAVRDAAHLPHIRSGTSEGRVWDAGFGEDLPSWPDSEG